MGEDQNQPFQLSFNPSLKVDFQGSRVTSDGGLILVRELDERLGFSDLVARHLTDSRGATGAGPAGLQSGQFVAATALPRRIENWSLTGQAYPLLLAAVGRESSDAAAVWQHGAANDCAADWIGAAGQANTWKSRRGRRGVGEITSERGGLGSNCAWAGASLASSWAGRGSAERKDEESSQAECDSGV